MSVVMRISREDQVRCECRDDNKSGGSGTS